jgi:hypothetical protein
MEMVFVLVSSGNWDGPFVDLDVYATEELARKAFKEQVQSAIEMYKEEYDESDLTFDVDDEHLCCEIYQTEFYDDYNHTIYIYPREVIKK